LPETDVEADYQLLRQTARVAGQIALSYFRKRPEVWMKAGNSPVSEADYAVDRYLREALMAARPDYGWLSEETADTAARLSARRTFVVDPIDGTRAFVDGADVWCVSVAVVEEGRSLAGVLDCPARGECFWAMKGMGAWRDGTPLQVRNAEEPVLIAGPRPMMDCLPAEWQARLKRHAYVPSLAYRIAMIAEGSLDATFVKANAHDWDIAAASLVLEEAGGRIVGPTGAIPPFARATVSHGPLAAGSGPLLEAMVACLPAPAGAT
jgi:myo-inositol-1(or 4)-monophosphatase